MPETSHVVATWSVVVAMPAHDEEGLGEFLQEIEEHLRPVVRSLAFVVVDDASQVPVSAPALGCASPIRVERASSNRGHGPSALTAYRTALDSGADVVVHVDGDGQFLGADFRTLLQAVVERDGAVGVRMGRTDPWFRRVISLGLRRMVCRGASVTDVNSPLRAYRRDVLPALLSEVPHDALVPHVHWTRLHRTLALDIANVPVTSIPRRGDSAVGVSWGGRRGKQHLPSRRLLTFCWRAVGELRLARATVSPSSPVTRVDDVAA